MTRVKGATHALKRRRKVLKRAKGFRHGRSTKEKLAREALLHAGRNAFRDRRAKKGMKRREWQIKLGAALKNLDHSYSKFIGAQKKKEIELDRKVLADIAENNPETFKRIVDEVMK